MSDYSFITETVGVGKANCGSAYPMIICIFQMCVVGGKLAVGRILNFFCILFFMQVLRVVQILDH